MNNEARKPIGILFVMAILAFTLELYYFNYNYFFDIGLGSSWFELKSQSLQSKKLFDSPLYLRIIVLFLFGIMIFLSKPKLKITEEKYEKGIVLAKAGFTAIIYLLLNVIYAFLGTYQLVFIAHIMLSSVFLVYCVYQLSEINKMFHSNILADRFQKESKKFDQCEKLIENQYSVNIKTADGFVNVVNPFRGSQVLGTPGSGKTYSFLVEALIQNIQKGYSILLYDYKYPSLANIAYSAMIKHYKESYKVKPSFNIINFDDLERSNRINPLQPELLLDPTDASGASQALMYGLYPKWAQKSGEFFTESSINFVAASIWALKKINNGKYCTLPHLIQFIALDYKPLFTILTQLDDAYINNIIAPFISAYKNDATDQLEGQIGTTRIALARLTSPYVYWVMTPEHGEGVSLQINDPSAPKILCLANNPDKQSVYGPILSLYNTRIMRLINKPNMLKTSVFLDELPTLSFPPGTLDNLIATGRSNKIAVWLGYQDFAQLYRDMGKEIAEAIINTVGNTFAGMVNFETADKLSRKFGKIKIQKESISTGKQGGSTTVSHSTAMEDLIPSSEIQSLPQGTFVGVVADDRGYEIEQKTFYSEIQIDIENRKKYEDLEIPKFVKFPNDDIEGAITKNFNRIKKDIMDLAEAYSQVIDNEDAIGNISEN